MNKNTVHIFSDFSMLRLLCRLADLPTLEVR